VGGEGAARYLLEGVGDVVGRVLVEALEAGPVDEVDQIHLPAGHLHGRSRRGGGRGGCGVGGGHGLLLEGRDRERGVFACCGVQGGDRVNPTCDATCGGATRTKNYIGPEHIYNTVRP
jgi:hypothetical protein